MNAQLAQFQTQAQRGQELSREEIYPGTVTFAGHPAIACSVRAGISSAALDEGIELRQPKTFLLLRSDLPLNLTLAELTTRFRYREVEHRVLTILSQPEEPQLRFVADLPSAPRRG